MSCSHLRLGEDPHGVGRSRGGCRGVDRLEHLYDRVKQAVGAETDRPHVLREMMYVCRPAGILSVAGVYGGMIDKIPFGASMNKGLAWHMGQTRVRRWTDELLDLIVQGRIDPSLVITYRAKLEPGPDMYQTFRDKEDRCIKVVLTPCRLARVRPRPEMGSVARQVARCRTGHPIPA